MGVGLAPILVKHERSLDELKGKYAVDAFNTLYQFLTTIRQRDGTPLMDSRGRITSHLSGLFYRTTSLLERGIQPIYVFDGEPFELKKRTHEERHARKVVAEEKLSKAREAGIEEDVLKFSKQTVRLTGEQVDESKTLLHAMGIPIIQAPSEGEAQCADMCKQGLVQAAASQDTDTIVFGTPRLIKNLTIAGKKRGPRGGVQVEVVPEEIILEENLRAMNITHEKLIWLAILVGTDFNAGIHGIGPKKGLKLVQKHDSMHAILNELGQTLDHEAIEKFFKHPPLAKVTKEDVRFQQPQKDKILEFMCDEHDFSKERIESALERAFKIPVGSEQSGLQKWF
ncbi:MAG TPA: flap endonuclease-1 [Candidatus Norongarragalinales archaeon]|jgi:flap endonuclease-1|nr:flap endonuclease-1 [Candidatus Norongarragalinales archaeon]